MASKGIPLDAPLFEIDPDIGVEYWNCEYVEAFYTLKGPVSALLPEGLAPTQDPALGLFVVVDYGRSAIGPYHEAASMIQVRDEAGEVGFYVPYIYVDSDVAMAGGREAMGFPKKLASIELIHRGDVVQGTLERPAGTRLATITMRPNQRFDPPMEALLTPGVVNLYNLRHVPGVDGRGELTQLVKSSTEFFPHRDARGREIVFTGATSVAYEARSPIDPVHNLEVAEMFAGVYLEFDAVLKPVSILRESFMPALEPALTR